MFRNDLIFYSLYTNDYNLLYLSSIVDKEKPIKQRFDFNSFLEEDYEFYFRFKKVEIIRLQKAMEIPEVISYPNGPKFTGREGLCILLRRLCYPNRLGELVPTFHRSIQELSVIFNYMVDLIIRKFGHLLESFDLFWMDQDHLQKYAVSIAEKGAPLQRCWGFIDGTLRAMCRPKYHQREAYNGHKRTHGIKFQSIVTPSGLISNLYGPVPGRRHDSYMLTQSQILEKLEIKMNTPEGQPYYLYGDPAYPKRRHLLGPFKEARLSEEKLLFNKKMSSVRECVEWEFGKVITLFAFVDFKKNLKLYLQPVAKLYKVAVLLTNCHTCINGSQTSMYFNIKPPELESYLNNQL